jgi:transcriptional regulator with XRE-family HTH domain
MRYASRTLGESRRYASYDCIVGRRKTKAAGVDSRADAEARAIGKNLGRIRRERGVTQVELADKLQIRQQLLSDYEVGRLRLHGELIASLARILHVTADELLGLAPASGDGTGVQRRFLRKLREVEKLSRRDQDALLRTIEAFLRGQLQRSA